MSSELNVLSRRLDRISEQHRRSRDFTLESLRDALREVIACFPVYRTYIRTDTQHPDEQDERYIRASIKTAKRRNPATSGSVFDFIQDLLLLKDPDSIGDADRAERRLFVMRFQQLTGPVMAKGLEDTAFYRYCPLLSLNEVGGSPDKFGVALAHFHGKNVARRQSWRNAMLASSTHDTKRSEDVRARINVLSEIPAEWYRAIRAWQRLNEEKKIQVAGEAVPSANEEYFLYQTLLGAWPLNPMDAAGHADFVGRIHTYMEKALREAKVNTSWINPNTEYEAAFHTFLDNILDRATGKPFLELFAPFQAKIARAGIFNSLSQTLLKIAAPGLPDFYQGTEVWNFSLADPDNRRPVDYDQPSGAARAASRSRVRGPGCTRRSAGCRAGRRQSQTLCNSLRPALPPGTSRIVCQGKLPALARRRRKEQARDCLRPLLPRDYGPRVGGALLCSAGSGPSGPAGRQRLGRCGSRPAQAASLRSLSRRVYRENGFSSSAG